MKRNMLFALMLVATLMSYNGMTWAGEVDVQSAEETTTAGTMPLDGPAGLDMEVRTIEDFDVAYVECQGTEQIEQGFGELFEAGSQQGLIGESMKMYLVYHGDLFSEPAVDAVFEPAFSLPDAAEVAAPLQVQTIPGGEYYVVMHHGAYENLDQTYRQFIIWAAGAGIKFDDRPNFECFLSNPDSTPVEEWLTEIYFPLAMATEDIDPVEETAAAEM